MKIEELKKPSTLRMRRASLITNRIVALQGYRYTESRGIISFVPHIFQISLQLSHDFADLAYQSVWNIHSFAISVSVWLVGIIRDASRLKELRRMRSGTDNSKIAMPIPKGNVTLERTNSLFLAMGSLLLNLKPKEI
jgi:hypothetical protein